MKIKVSNNIKDLTGSGEEWLLDESNDVIAVFIDGNMTCKIIPIGNTEITKADAA